MALEKKKHNLYNLFAKDLFLVNDELQDKATFIQKLCQRLEKTSVISHDFIEKVMSREAMIPTNITPYMAIPHAITSELTKSQIIIGLSDKPVQWSNDSTVKVVFLLAISEKDKDKLQLFFEYLSEIIDDTKLQKELANAKSFEAFIKILKINKRTDAFFQ